mmetsp:Transcript_23970/g.55337  ORF Transcript_23970/g.55337 Transcript_23970/m.55337 type:complete len:880 (-) Transcript_23970:91-2730(-)
MAITLQQIGHGTNAFGPPPGDGRNPRAFGYMPVMLAPPGIVPSLSPVVGGAPRDGRRPVSPARWNFLLPAHEPAVMVSAPDIRSRSAGALPAVSFGGHHQTGGPLPCASEPLLHAQSPPRSRSPSPCVERRCTDPSQVHSPAVREKHELFRGAQLVREQPSRSSLPQPEDVMHKLQEQNEGLAKQVQALEQAKCMAAMQSEQTKRRIQTRMEQARHEAEQAKQRAKDVASQAPLDRSFGTLDLRSLPASFEKRPLEATPPPENAKVEASSEAASPAQEERSSDLDATMQKPPADTEVKERQPKVSEAPPPQDQTYLSCTSVDAAVAAALKATEAVSVGPAQKATSSVEDSPGSTLRPSASALSDIRSFDVGSTLQETKSAQQLQQQARAAHLDAMGNPLPAIRPWALPNIKDDPPPQMPPLTEPPGTGIVIATTTKVEAKDGQSASFARSSDSLMTSSVLLQPLLDSLRGESKEKLPPQAEASEAHSNGGVSNGAVPQTNAETSAPSRLKASGDTSRLRRPSSVRAPASDKGAEKRPASPGKQTPASPSRPSSVRVKAAAGAKAVSSGTKTPPSEPPKASTQTKPAAQSNTGPSEALAAELEDCIDTIKWSADIIKKDAIQEIKLIAHPPAAVIAIVEAVAVLVGLPTTGWDKLRRLVSSASFAEKVEKLKLQQVTREQFMRLRAYLERDTFDEEHMKEVCVPAVPLATWCRAVGYYLSRTKFRGYPTIRPVAAAAAAGLPTSTSDRAVDLVFTPDIMEMDEDELRNVEDLSISREGVGSIQFHGVVDLVGLDLYSIVRLEVGEVRVYPDPSDKPDVGQGLNRAATVTMYQCWPPKTLTDPADEEKYRMKIRQMTEEKQAKFVDYNCNSGIWKFTVDHF